MKKGLLRFINVNVDEPNVLKHINMSFFEGEIVGITGLLDSSYMNTKVLFEDSFKPSSGFVQYEYLDKKVAMINWEDKSRLYYKKTVLENLIVLRKNVRCCPIIGWNNDGKKLQKELYSLGIDLNVNNCIYELKQVQKSILQVLKCVFEGYSIILLDHVFLNLSQNEKKVYIEALLSIQKKYAITVVMISSNIELLKICCKRIYLIDASTTVFCMEKEQYSSKKVVNYQYNHMSTNDYINIEQNDWGEPKENCVLSLVGQIEPEDRKFNIQVLEGELVGILDIGSKACDNLTNAIVNREECSWHYFSMNKTEYRLAYFDYSVVNSYFPNMNIEENITVHGISSISFFHQMFISKSMKKFMYREFLDFLDKLGYPLNRQKAVYIESLSIEQKIILSFYLILIKNPKVLIIDHPCLGYPIRIVNLVKQIINIFRKRKCAILIIDNNMENTMHFCLRSYVFIDREYMGLFDKNTDITIDFFK